MSVTLEKENIYKHGHAHAFVIDADEEGYDVTELKRAVEVKGLLTEIINEEDRIAEIESVLNVESLTQEEQASLRWKINGIDDSRYNATLVIEHTLEDKNKEEVKISAYIEGKEEDIVHESIYFAYNENEDVDIEEDK